uniref:hypothetical protein n=1 Tax=Prevotella sp. TaxID=59823 RepID=UPI004025D665
QHHTNTTPTPLHICTSHEREQPPPHRVARRAQFFSKKKNLKHFFATCDKKKRIGKKTKGNPQENRGLPFVSKRIGKFKSYSLTAMISQMETTTLLFRAA